METILSIGMGSLRLIWDVAVIVIPIMLVLEILKDLKWLDIAAGWLAPALGKIHLSRAAALPLLVGLVFGIAYGAGVIIAAAREGELSRKDLHLLSIFLVLNHAIIEDTLLFARIGASGWLLLTARTVMAIIVTWMVGKWLLKEEQSWENSSM
ncbi:MAG: nucleoside recognition domain-containing protein [Bacillota bacterium]|uniref:Nucleoside recognition n=2 Tax=Carboxydocella TaxID=178898 RepID=A0A1T4QNS8_9FIRM|nr:MULTISPECIES: nucleoside recognition domain-containing protein [Carboxydocella]AVX21554.1 Nucleoside recognition [Carboxydocella thermautotrophica]AVX32035.1 Nucleoside recognition [Carboxydocella thermautotrophica]SKA05354.1 Nucleoside recognition [Carboxydocella sporoproducens DSM 16521]GAW27733.1 nucleoside recognition protein [Carboxydocella sp. ULO1]GAW31925.1 nucleoside recognition protein [Carboxydocella sp. JDF658]